MMQGARVNFVGRIDRAGARISRPEGKPQYARFKVTVRRERRKESRADTHIVRVSHEHILNEIVAPKARRGVLVYVEGILQYRQYRSQDGSNHKQAVVHVTREHGTIQILEGSEGELI